MKDLIVVAIVCCQFWVSAQTYDIYVSDAGKFSSPPWQILKFDQDGSNPTKFIEEQLAWPQDILFMEESGTVLISNLNSGKITRYDAETGDYIDDFATMINGPTRMKIGPDSLLYVLQWNGPGFVQRYRLDGTYLGEFTTVGVPRSIGLDWDVSGNLYVSSYSADLVRRFDAAGNDLGIFINSNLEGPTNIWLDGEGDLLVSDYDGNAVKRFNSTGVFKGEFLQGLRHSEGVAFFPNGDILIGNGFTHSVKRFNQEGDYIEDTIENGSGELLTPNAVVLREKPASGIFQRKRKEQLDFIYPRTGAEFRLREAYQQDFVQFTIYNQNGQQIWRANQPMWSATNCSDGMYFIRVELKNGEKHTNQVIVQN